MWVLAHEIYLSSTNHDNNNNNVSSSSSSSSSKCRNNAYTNSNRESCMYFTFGETMCFACLPACLFDCLPLSLHCLSFLDTNERRKKNKIKKNLTTKTIVECRIDENCMLLKSVYVKGSRLRYHIEEKKNSIVFGQKSETLAIITHRSDAKNTWHFFIIRLAIHELVVVCKLIWFLIWI